MGDVDGAGMPVRTLRLGLLAGAASLGAVALSLLLGGSPSSAVEEPTSPAESTVLTTEPISEPTPTPVVEETAPVTEATPLVEEQAAVSEPAPAAVEPAPAPAATDPAPVEATPVEGAQVEAAPVEAAPVESAPVEATTAGSATEPVAAAVSEPVVAAATEPAPASTSTAPTAAEPAAPTTSTATAAPAASGPSPAAAEAAAQPSSSTTSLEALVERLVRAVSPAGGSSALASSELLAGFDPATLVTPELMRQLLGSTFEHWLGALHPDALDTTLRDAVRHALEHALDDAGATLDEAISDAVRDAVHDVLEEALADAIDLEFGRADGGAALGDCARSAAPAMATSPLSALVSLAASIAWDRDGTVNSTGEATRASASAAVDATAATGAPAPLERAGEGEKLSRALGFPLEPAGPKAMQSGSATATGGAGASTSVAVPVSLVFPDLAGAGVGADDPSRMPESRPQDCIAHPN